MSDILSGLTPEQREAVTHINGPLLVLAGPGSGKTRVITRRVAYLIYSGIRPWNILAITFTNKAASEMRRRVDELVEDRGVWVSTFHAFCARQLRRFAERLGYGRDFTIIDADDSRKLLRRIISARELSSEEWKPGAVQAEISTLKAQLNTAEDLALLAESSGDRRQAILAQLYRAYQSELTGSNCMDFDDLLMQMALLLARDEQAREKIRARHQFVLVDEFQDTNHTQYEIARLLAAGHRNLAATGDPDQSIYGWRGARIRNILNFEKDFPDTRVVYLNRNYRSTGTIIKAADAVVSHNLSRKKRTLYTANPDGEKIRLAEHPDGADEARAVAKTIREDLEKGFSARDIAVFYRVNHLSRQFEDALIKEAIPYQIIGGVEFYNRKEIKDVLAYLRALANPADDTSVERVINTPPRRVGARSVEALRHWAGAAGVQLLEAARSPEARSTLAASSRAGVERFLEILAQIETAVPLGPRAAVAAAIDSSGYIDMLRTGPTDDAEERIDNINELVAAAAEFEETNAGATLSDFLDQAALVSDIDNWHEHQAKVTLMTMHAAKGLEFPVVFMTALEESIIPHARSSGSADELEEERRLFFVALTRAEKRLYLSYAVERMIYGAFQANLPTRFIGEIPSELIETFPSTRLSGMGGLSLDSGNTRPTRQRSVGLNRKTAAVLQPGTHVRSAKFGLGVVESVESQGRYHKAAVRFAAAGRKLVILEKANLEVVNT